MAKKQQQLSAADIAAQAQLQEEVEIQKAFETGIEPGSFPPLNRW